jgi:4-hydroxy-tetrahydrodipicolinate reductase
VKLILVGYGKMGRMIDSLAAGQGFEVVARFDETPDRIPPADAAIEFSTPETALGNIERLCRAKLPMVVGTTGWFAQLGEARTMVEAAGTGLVYGANFSIGVALFRRLAAEAGKMFAAESSYEAWAWEMHHSAKKDAPSGTLLQLVDEMRRAGYTPRIDVSSSRAGRVPGTHEIGFDSAADTVTLRHTARNREGFALGALRAARWIAGRQGVFEFQEIL